MDKKTNYFDEIMHDLLTGSENTNLDDLFRDSLETLAKTVGAATEILKKYRTIAEEQDNQGKEDNNAEAPSKEMSLSKYVAPKADVLENLNPYRERFIKSTHIANFAYNDDPVKSDEFIKNHLDNSVFKIFANGGEANHDTTVIREKFIFQGGDTYVFEWDWKDESFVLVEPETEVKPKYNNYQRKFVPYETVIEKTNVGTAKDEYVKKQISELKNVSREEIAEQVERIVDTYDPDLFEHSEVTATHDFSDEDVIDVVEASLRNFDEENIYVKDHNPIGVKFSEFNLIRDLSIKRRTVLAVGEVYDASDVFSVNRCKLIAKTFRFSKVTFDGELKLEF